MSLLIKMLELVRSFFYLPHPSIDQAPRNDTTSLTTHATHVTQANM